VYDYKKNRNIEDQIKAQYKQIEKKKQLQGPMKVQNKKLHKNTKKIL